MPTPKTVVLDSSCLLGVHRLMGTLTSRAPELDRIILPPDIATSAWPTQEEVSSFAYTMLMQTDARQSQVQRERNSGPWFPDKTWIHTIVDEQRHKVDELLGELEEIGRLHRPDVAEWPVADPRAYSDFEQILLALETEWVSLPESTKLSLRIGYPDLHAIAACWYHGFLPESYSGSIRGWLFPQFIRLGITPSVESYRVPGDIAPRDLEQYLENAENQRKIMQKYRATEAEIKRKAIIIGRDQLVNLIPVVGEVKSGIESICRIVKNRVELERQDALWGVISSFIESSNHQTVAVMEDLEKYIMSRKPKYTDL